jgi:hypothetical protein
LLHRTAFPYAYPTSKDRPLVKEADIVRLVKLTFLAKMRSEFGDEFFRGEAPLTVEFFDRWWTIVPFGMVDSVRDVLKGIDANDLTKITSSQSIAVRGQIEWLTHSTDASREVSPLPEIRRHVQLDVAAGFKSTNEIVQSLVTCFERDHDVQLIQFVTQQIVEAEIVRHRELQNSWPEITDCDRLDWAFAELQSSEIVARQNAPCCGSCAGSAIAKQIEEQQSAGKTVRGYVFYHEQDAEAAVLGRGLYLSFGSTTEEVDAALAIMHEACNALRRNGLIVAWDGSFGTKPHVQLVWQRRR